MNRTPPLPPGKVRPSLTLVAIFTSALLLAGCDSPEQERSEARATAPQNAEAPRVATVDGATIITLDATEQKRSGIGTTMLAAASGTEPSRAYAAVLDVGPLIDLRNAALNADAQVAAARARAAASRPGAERARMLYRDAQNVSLAQLQAADASYQSDQAAVAAAQAQAATVTANARAQFGNALGALRSPLVQSLSERRTLLLQVTTPPDTTITAPPRRITVVIDGHGPAQAQFISAATRTDPRIQGASFYYIIPATSGLVSGMNVMALLPTTTSRSGVVVPGSAMVVWQGQSWAYQQTGPRTYKRVPVATDLAASGGYLVATLPPGARLVTTGAQLLLSEELRPQTQAAGDED
ncbi:hypothetical protein PX554_25060 [Sphingomonas sp. H39-1-10]|uniref:hypothetical protein n=1 Tax=Sphingomonas pollutisoli TaxID=3030829 RepID=UPI0023B9FC56|nr:hypothetical protein [Sphingomonas pollutisoli]MDF0491390.1 hypothetical protein [Sphingomonas pollutisoli]